MTHTDYTKKILRIEDNNIYFNEDCLEIKTEDNKEYNIFHGYLTYNPDYIKYKKYWKLLLKNKDELDDNKKF